ncbi:hypothetical protein [Aphanothece sacrum]|uniref:hypothetical protein n=1 Tax=Aphanothece sacrum TaxID=1122 RepID=UPI0034CDD401
MYNFYLNKTNNQYQETGIGMTYCQMAKDLTQLKKLPDFEICKNQRLPPYNRHSKT